MLLQRRTRLSGYGALHAEPGPRPSQCPSHIRADSFVGIDERGPGWRGMAACGETIRAMCPRSLVSPGMKGHGRLR